MGMALWSCIDGKFLIAVLNFSTTDQSPITLGIRLGTPWEVFGTFHVWG